ncbi:MAG: cell division protein ZapE [Pseudomonadota bacterium]|nr:cell division protein ZapE [Pseudomonadota bacterium]
MSDSTTPASLEAAWQDRIAAGDISFDAAQREALKVVQEFADRLAPRAPQGPGWLRALLGGGARTPVKGLYLYGGVGRGKTMLMDLFFSHVPIEKKRRVHFHAFMLEVQERLFQSQKTHTDAILPAIAADLAKEARLLCFDEFHVSNIADAMILGRLFGALFDAGVALFATSNWRPNELYRNGLQRDRFLPFIDLIETHMVVHHLEGTVDHRYEQMRGLPICYYPLNEEATRKLQGLFLQLTDEVAPQPIDLPLQGRTLRIVHAAKGVGYFNFDELCGRPLGAADFLAIARCLHTILIDGVPIMQAERRDETIRFMTLIDALYEAKAKLFITAAAATDKLAPTGEHAFAFQRTLSRIAEMSGTEYRQKPHLSET